MTTKTTWGGRRPGSGRKPLNHTPSERITVTLPRRHIEALRQLSKGNLSRAVRQAIEHYLAQQQGGNHVSPEQAHPQSPV